MRGFQEEGIPRRCWVCRLLFHIVDTSGIRCMSIVPDTQDYRVDLVTAVHVAADNKGAEYMLETSYDDTS